MNKTRYSILLLGALSNKFKTYSLSYPGGCNLDCPRPIDFHIMALEELGMHISTSDSLLIVEIREPLKGARIELPRPSVSATENVILSAVLTHGTTIIKNSSVEPEVVDLCFFLNKCGARIFGFGTHVITIEGVNYLTGTDHNIIPDRIEVGTFISLAAIGKIKLGLSPINSNHIHAILSAFNNMGVRFVEDDGYLLVDATGSLMPVRISTKEFPGFPADLGPIMSAVCLTVKGESRINDTIYPMRHSHIAEFCKLGAKAKFENGTAIIIGGNKLKGAKLFAHNIRAGAAVVLASLVAEGTSEIDNILHIERGYERFPEKLRTAGATIYEEISN